MEFEGFAVRETGTETLCITPENVYTLMQSSANLAQEQFSIICLSVKNFVIKEVLISLGTVSSTLVHPREVFRAAVLASASSIILTHNHPSGDTTPSAEDIKITKELIAAGEIMKIKVLDHVIIGSKPGQTPYLSLRECGLVKF